MGESEIAIPLGCTGQFVFRCCGRVQTVTDTKPITQVCCGVCYRVYNVVLEVALLGPERAFQPGQDVRTLVEVVATVGQQRLTWAADTMLRVADDMYGVLGCDPAHVLVHVEVAGRVLLARVPVRDLEIA
jgi:hypothetical protein